MAATEWKSFDDQLELLQSRGLSVRDEPTARTYLSRIGYFCLSGYWYPFRILKPEPEGLAFREDSFIEGSQFEDALALYNFDRKLRLIALDALERIERALRVDVAHRLGSYDAFAQYEPALLHGDFTKRVIARGANRGKTGHAAWLAHHDKLIKRNDRLHFVAHNMEKYGRLPIWISIEVWDFGALSRLYSGMQVKDRDAIAQAYGLPDGRVLGHWLRSLSYLRNIAAHHSRMWNVNVLEVSPVPVFSPEWTELHNHRPFMYFCIMQRLLKHMSPTSDWKKRFSQLIAEFPEPANKVVSPSDFGLIEGWEKWPEWT